MRKTYRYKGLKFTATDDTEIIFKIEFISDGNTGQTVINIPGDTDPEIEDAGAASLGFAKNLRVTTTISFSAIANPVPEEEEIRIRYSINGQQVVEHSNPKSEEEQPNIVLFIDFPCP